MTREEAIYWIENHSGNWGEQYREARNMAFAALMEPEKLESNLKVLESSDWISVEERLPEEFKTVLICWVSRRKRPSVNIGYYSDKGEWRVERDWLRNVSHWMPLPEPPEVEG